MRDPSFFRLALLRLQLVGARLRILPPWQLAFFTIALSVGMLGALVVLPVIVPVFGAVDHGIVVGDTVLLVTILTALGIHLLLAQGDDSHLARRIVDPMELLPVRPQMSFYLTVLEEVVSDPASLLVILPCLLGIARASARPFLGLCLSVIVAPAVLAVIAGVRLLAARAARALLTPRTSQALSRATTYSSLLVTVILGGMNVYDLFALASGLEEKLEPMALSSARFGLILHQLVRDYPFVARGLPLSWPVLALTGGPGWQLYLALVLGGTAATLALAARAYAALNSREDLEQPLPGKGTGASLLARFLSTWLPISNARLIQLEVAVASARGLLSEVLLEGWFLVGALIILFTLSPQRQGRAFTDGFRFLSGLLTLLLMTPAAALAREAHGLTMRLSLPLPPADILLSKVPVTLLANVLLILPSAVCLPFIMPPAEPLVLLGAACLLGVLAVAASLTAVGAGMLAAPLASERATFGRQFMALALSGLAVAPLTLVAPVATPYMGAAAVIASGLMIAGLWQKALARILSMSCPPPDRMPPSLLGDATLAAVIFLFAGTSLTTTFQAAFPDLSADASQILSTCFVQLLLIHYVRMYLHYRKDVFQDRPLLRGSRTQAARGVGFGILAAGLGLLYSQWITRFLNLDVKTSGGPIVKAVAEASQDPLLATVALVTGCLLAPLAEELLFRRLLFLGLAEATGRAAPAAFISGLLFAVLHPPVGFPVIFLIGLATAGLLRKTGNLTSSIFFHMAFNSAQLLMVWARGH